MTLFPLLYGNTPPNLPNLTLTLDPHICTVWRHNQLIFAAFDNLQKQFNVMKKRFSAGAGLPPSSRQPPALHIP